MLSSTIENTDDDHVTPDTPDHVTLDTSNHVTSDQASLIHSGSDASTYPETTTADQYDELPVVRNGLSLETIRLVRTVSMMMFYICMVCSECITVLMLHFYVIVITCSRDDYGKNK